MRPIVNVCEGQAWRVVASAVGRAPKKSGGCQARDTNQLRWPVGASTSPHIDSSVNMANHRPPGRADMNKFIVDDTDTPNSQSTWLPGPSSPRSTPVTRPARRGLLNPDNARRQALRPATPTSSVNYELEDDELEAVEADRSQTRAQDSDAHDVRPLREAAVRALSPLRKHSRIDLGYVSDLAEADDSDEADELDADSQQYAPFGTQVQEELEIDLGDEIPESEDIGCLTGAVTVTEDKLVELMHNFESNGYAPLIKEALNAEHASGSKFGVYLHNEAQELWAEMSLRTLCSMPERAVKELVCGNLKQAYDSDANLHEKLDEFQERGKQHPCIYVRSLTTADGELMTTAEARRLAKWLQRYVSESPSVVEHDGCKEAFRRIDNQFRGQWKRVNREASRAYLASTKQDRIQSRVDNVRLFSRELIARCEESEKKGVPLKPLLYIGYAARADRRKRQHEACGKSSNWLATLVQAICNVLWGQGRFQMHFMVLCLLADEAQGMIAEMLLTRIAGAYYNVGGGFCIDVAGKSMESLHFTKLTHDENVDRWNELGEWVHNNTPVDDHAVACVEKWKAKQKRQTADRVKKTLLTLDQIHDDVAELHRIYSMCCKYRNEPEWQTDEIKALVAKMDADWHELGHTLFGDELYSEE